MCSVVCEGVRIRGLWQINVNALTCSLPCWATLRNIAVDITSSQWALQKHLPPTGTAFRKKTRQTIIKDIQDHNQIIVTTFCYSLVSRLRFTVSAAKPNDLTESAVWAEPLSLCWRKKNTIIQQQQKIADQQAKATNQTWRTMSKMVEPLGPLAQAEY